MSDYRYLIAYLGQSKNRVDIGRFTVDVYDPKDTNLWDRKKLVDLASENSFTFSRDNREVDCVGGNWGYVQRTLDDAGNATLELSVEKINGGEFEIHPEPDHTSIYDIKTNSIFFVRQTTLDQFSIDKVLTFLSKSIEEIGIKKS